MKYTDADRAAALELYEQLGSARQVATETGIARRTIDRWVEELAPKVSGRVDSFQTFKRPLPPKGKVYRYILTSAQNNTKINKPVWDNLLALKDHYNAELMVSRYAYNKSGFQPEKGAEELWYAPEITPFTCDDRIHLSPNIDFCGELSILPTATNPLSGLQSYTARSSGVFPHAKIAMESIPSNKYEATKFNYTTGTVTMRNYISKKAGLKAEFHHVYGALLVEIDSDGDYWARQLNADKSGTIQDLNIKAENGKIKPAGVASITWGDIHEARLDGTVRALAWGKHGILNTLRPAHQFFHDLVDFKARNHHNRDCHSMFERYIDGEDDVEEEMRSCAHFLNDAAREWCQSVIVDSNHDNALMRWLREADYRTDPVNACFFLKCQAKVYSAIRNKDKNFHLIEWVLSHMRDPAYRHVTRFLREDESFVVKDIEQGMHGHLGPNGARGAPQGFAKMGRKCNVGHSHSAGIKDGVYTAGHSGETDMGYNKGPSSWSHSFILTYETGKRAIVTIWDGRWRG